MISLNDGKRHRVFDDDRITADKGFETDTAELVNARIRADIGAVVNLDVTGERRGVCHYNLVSQKAIVRDVRLRHQQISVADLGQTAAALRAAMNGDEFADVISIADFNACRFAAVFQILRRKSDGNERENFIVIADLRIAVNDDVRFEPVIFAQNDFSPTVEKAPI